MNIAETLKRHGLRSAVIVDDAYELPRANHLTPQDRGQLLNLVRDDDANAEALVGVFPEIDPDIDDQVTNLLASDETVQRIWSAIEGELAWCRPVFTDFESRRATKRAPLLPLEQYLQELGVPFDMLPTWDAERPADDIGILFVDFFLDTDDADEALVRSVRVASKFAERTGSNPTFRPMVFLISSRSNRARRVQENFRTLSKIRGSFFRFIDKDDLRKEIFEPRLKAALTGYGPGMRFDDYLSEFENAATAAIQRLRDLELTDLSLLNLLRIEGEGERLGAYLNWLLTEAVSGGVQSSEALHEVASRLESGVNHPLDGHNVAARNLLFDIYTDAVFRYDVRDRSSYARRHEVGFGDIFVHRYAAEAPRPLYSVSRRAGRMVRPLSYQRRASTRYLAVITPSSDLLRQTDPNFPVLCSIGKLGSERYTDIRELLKLELEREKERKGDNPKVPHILRLKEGSEAVYRVVKWETKGTCTVPIETLKTGRDFTRIARMQLLFAHELKQQCLNSLGRVGVPVRPTIVSAMDASVKINIAAGAVTFDTEGVGIFAGIVANKREKDGPQMYLVLSMAFMSELAKLAREADAKATEQEKTKVKTVIEFAEQQNLEHVVPPKYEVLHKNVVKILVPRPPGVTAAQPGGPQNVFCEITLTSVQ